VELIETGLSHQRSRPRAALRDRARATELGLYRGAIGFDRHLPWLVHEEPGAPSFAAARSALPDRAVVTREVI
jgi:hypothetical protein